jgi:TRAP-type C4-dicarboxylate transport system permease small subunit
MYIPNSYSWVWEEKKMNSFVNIYLKLMEFLDVGVRKLIILLAGLMTVAVSLQVICRYIMKNPLVWTEELARYLMIWMVFTGASCIIKKWNNINVDFFLNKFKKKPREIVILIQKFVIFGLLVYSFYLCLMVFPEVGAVQITPALGISMLWSQSSMIVGFLLMSLQMLGVILDDIFKKKIFNSNKEISNCGGAGC